MSDSDSESDVPFFATAASRVSILVVNNFYKHALIPTIKQGKKRKRCDDKKWHHGCLVAVLSKDYDGYYYEIVRRRPQTKYEKDCYDLVCVHGPNCGNVGETAEVQGGLLREADEAEFRLAL